jgi:integrase
VDEAVTAAKRASGLPPGIRRHGAGYQTRVSVARAGQSAAMWPLNTPIAEMAAWIVDERHRLQVEARGQTTPIEPGTFTNDARRYLKTIAAMKDHKRRAVDIQEWVDRFGSRRRQTITSQEIWAIRDQWLTVGPKWVYHKRTATAAAHWEATATPLSGSTVNHRLRALSNLYRVLDGPANPRRPNPVRDVPEAAETPALPRMIHPEKIDALLAVLADRGRPTRHERRSSVSLTKIRLRVLAWTGLAPAQLVALGRDAVDLDAATMRTGARLKGAGADPVLLPLLPQAVEAFRAYDAAGLWQQSFSTSSVMKSFKRAAAKVGLPPTVRVYDLRHSFGSRVFIASGGNLHAVGALLQHHDDRTTRRYTLAAVNPVLTAALAPLHPPKPEAYTPPTGQHAGQATTE